MLIEILGAGGVLLFGLASLAVGLRLLALGYRTRQLPELALGLGLTVGVLLGYVPENAALLAEDMPSESLQAVHAVAQVAIRGAALAVLVFTWRVFRPQAVWAAVVAAGLAAVLAVTWFVFPGTDTAAVTPSERLASELYRWSRSLCLFWGSAESARYYLLSRRRLRLGLGSAMLTHRFLLWSLAMAGTGLIMGSTLIAGHAGIHHADPAWVLAESATGVFAAVCIWLTFFPTERYRRLVEARA